MSSYWDTITEGLYNITCSRYNVEYPNAKLLIRMMAKIAEIMHEKDTSDYDKERARLYFESDDFSRHCLVLNLQELIVHQLLTSTPVKLDKPNKILDDLT